jgi:hypothetical protein
LSKARGIPSSKGMNARLVRSLAAVLALGHFACGEEIVWQKSGPGLAMTRFTNAEPVIFTAVRIELDRFGKEFALATTLASNQVVGTEPLASQITSLPKEFGTPVAAMNADFFMMNGAAKGDPRGLHIWRGELVSVPAGPAAFWQDSKLRLHGDPVSSKLTLAWPGGGTNLAGLNEQLGTNSMVLFTPRMGPLNSDRTTTNASKPSSSNRSPRPAAAFEIPQGGPIRPPGGREFLLEHAGSGPWLPLRLGRTYHARVMTNFDGFIDVPARMMLMSLGSNLLDELPEITNGTPVTINVATDPDLSGIEHALGTGPMLVRDGQVYEVKARMSEQLHPRAALGWNGQHLFFAVADGRQKDISVGIKLSEMADFMIDLGCQEAIDMDGGQSTTLMLNGRIINQQPSGRHDIANGIVVLRKTRTDNDDSDP